MEGIDCVVIIGNIDYDERWNIEKEYQNCHFLWDKLVANNEFLIRKAPKVIVHKSASGLGSSTLDFIEKHNKQISAKECAL